MCDQRKALYLFCFAEPTLKPDLEGVGVDGCSPVFVRSFPAAAAVLSTVSLEEFSGPSAERNMADLAWVGPRACRHEEVIEAVMRHSPVFPAHFGTLFSSAEALEKLIAMHSEAISHFLHHVAGQAEWAVKGFLDRAQARRSALAKELGARESELATLPPGRRYLREQKVRAEAEEVLRRWLNEICCGLADKLRWHASAFVERKAALQNGTEKEIETVVNWAFLLPESKVTTFRSEVELASRTHAEAGLAFRLSGPFPPYSFAPPLPIEGAA